jgi:dTDP-4-amino-4,6-dideoxygalactose transaminase
MIDITGRIICINNLKLIKPLAIPDLALSSYWVFTVLIELSEQKRNWILEKLNNEGIGAGLVHLPNNNYSCFEESNSSLIQTELFAATQISLPCGWWLESKDIEYIASQLIILVEEAKKID